MMSLLDLNILPEIFQMPSPGYQSSRFHASNLLFPKVYFSM
jgi:hypothetical protein